jgi:hypothetical protein
LKFDDPGDGKLKCVQAGVHWVQILEFDRSPKGANHKKEKSMATKKASKGSKGLKKAKKLETTKTLTHVFRDHVGRK